MRNQKQLLIGQLERKLKPYYGIEKIAAPEHGWINSIRLTLNMTLEQLGKKLGVTRQGAKRIETSESSGTISLRSMKEIAEVLDMQFVYGFVPKGGSVENLINEKAEALARKIVSRTNHNMVMEAQGNSDEQLKKAVTDLADDLKREMSRSLWD